MIYLFHPSSMTNTSINNFQILDSTRVLLEVDKISCLTVFSASNPLFWENKSPVFIIFQWNTKWNVQKSFIRFGKCEGTASENQDRSPEFRVENDFPALILLYTLFFLHSCNFCGYLGVFIITKSKLASRKKKANGNRFPCVFENYNKMYTSFNWNIHVLFFFCIAEVCVEI